MNGRSEEFREIAHSGGKVTIQVRTDPQKGRYGMLRWENSRPNAAAVFSIYALFPGVPVATAVLGGLGSPAYPEPVPGSIHVMIGSDSEGLFGRLCPSCNGYWRSNVPSGVCPYCGVPGEAHHFLTVAQQAYVHEFCVLHQKAASSMKDGDYVIDFDALADVAAKEVEKPPFYLTEKSQQNKFKCSACRSVTDVLGKFGYCTSCGTRNDLQELEAKTLGDLRVRINAGGPYEACVRDAVSAFDSFVGQYVKELVSHVPMTSGRRNRLGGRFHNLEAVAAEFRETFDIRILDGIDSADQAFAMRMFYRRHVYEHNGGEADEKYIAQSGDQDVRPKQALHETRESAHNIVSLVGRMAKNLHNGFHELFPPNPNRIRRSSS